MLYIIVFLIYYIISSIIFKKLYEREAIFGVLNTFDEIIVLIPLIRLVYYINLKL